MLILALLLGAPTCARAGPPFLTDDPEPTETGHWEIYCPLVEGEGRGAEYAGSVGAEINYGPARNVQLTIGLPIAFRHDRTRMEWGAGDVAVSAKLRVVHAENAGLSIAVFPGVNLPTASHALGSGKVTGFLPIWGQKDSGSWTIFGGGGYAVQSGDGDRNYWVGSIAISRQFLPPLLVGLEASRQGAGTVGGSASTSLGLGVIYQLKVPFRLLGSGGPTLEGGGGAAGFHAFVALGLDL